MLHYSDNSNAWPFVIYRMFLIPQKLEFDVQRTGQNIYLYIWEGIYTGLQFELCEVEIYGEFFKAPSHRQENHFKNLSFLCFYILPKFLPHLDSRQ
jgi:hypothetical protein